MIECCFRLPPLLLKLLKMGKLGFHSRMRNNETIVKQNLQGTAGPNPNIKPTLYSNQTVPISRQLFEIISLLKSEGKPLSNNEIIRKKAIDVMGTPELLKVVTQNDRIIIVGDTFEFKPTFKIKTKQDFLKLLKDHRGVMAMEVKELLNSCNNVLDIIKELQESGQILVIENKDGSPKVVYYNDPLLNLKVSNEFIENWNSVSVPLDIDLQKELLKVGLKPVKVLKKKLDPAMQAANKKKKRKTRFKLTNTHLEGVGIEFLIRFVQRRCPIVDLPSSAIKTRTHNAYTNIVIILLCFKVDSWFANQAIVS